MSVDYVKANDNIVEESKDLVLTQFANSDNIQKFVEIIAEEAKSYEEVAEKVFTSFLLVNSEGFTLDSIGEFLNFPRDGRTDDGYRIALIISAIGSGSEITRDSIYTLVEIVTGGLGGYFYNGRYHDLYIYLQDACAERAIAAEFLDKYLPANTQASVLFESGESFGFEGNDGALGFSKVYQTSGEGAAFVKYSIEESNSVPDVTLPNNFEFLGEDGYTYRTTQSTDLETSIVAVEWDIPNTYATGDTLSLSFVKNSTREVFSESYQVQNTATSTFEIMEFSTDTLLQAGLVDARNVYADDSSGYKVYAGYAEITNTSDFSGRSSSATEFLSGNIMRTVGNDVLRDRRDPDTSAVIGILYETPATNLVPYGNDISAGTGYWNMTGVLDSSTIQSSIHLLYGAQDYTFTSDIMFDGAIVVPSDGYYTFSVFFRTSLGATVDQVIGIDTDRAIFSDTNPSITIIQDDFGTFKTQYYGLWVRAEVTQYLTAGAHTIYIGSEGSGRAVYFGAMVERGRRSSSYIPTTGTVATRDQDFFAFTEEPTPVGFDDSVRAVVDVKDYSGIFAWSEVELSNLSKGAIPVTQGMLLTPQGDVGFTLFDSVTSTQWTAGIGDIGILTYDESYSTAGGFCTRVSLTSRDILGFGTVSTPENLEYDLNSKLSDVVGLSMFSEFDNFRTPNLLGEYNLFRPQDWDGNLSIAPEPSSESVVLRSPEGIAASALYDQIQEAVDQINNQPNQFSGTNLNASDIFFPNKPYYWEVDFNKLINSPAIRSTTVRLESNSFSADTSVDNGSPIISAERCRHSIEIINRYDPFDDDYQILARTSNSSNIYDYDVEADVFDSSIVYSSLGGADLLTYTDATAEGSVTIGVLYDPVGRTYTVYVNGVEYNGTDGLLLYTTVTGNDTSGAVAGQIYVTPDNYRNSGIFDIKFRVDNSDPEPATVDDYGTVEFIYNRDQLKYTSQLPSSTVDIFGRRINQEI